MSKNFLMKSTGGLFGKLKIAKDKKEGMDETHKSDSLSDIANDTEFPSWTSMTNKSRKTSEISYLKPTIENKILEDENNNNNTDKNNNSRNFDNKNNSYNVDNNTNNNNKDVNNSYNNKINEENDTGKILSESEKELIKQFNDKMQFTNNATKHINNNNSIMRRASDSSYIQNHSSQPSQHSSQPSQHSSQPSQHSSQPSQNHSSQPSQHLKKPTTISPSHYKGRRRGTYAAVYDPRVTLARPRTTSGKRSKSLFIKADESMLTSASTTNSKSSSPSQNDLRVQLLKSYHAKNSSGSGLSSSGTTSSSTSSDEDNSITIGLKLKNQQSRQKDVGTKYLQEGEQREPYFPFRKHVCRHRQHHPHSTNSRAHSTIHNLSKEHLRYLEQKLIQSKREETQCDKNDVCDDNNNNNTKNGDIRTLPSLHGAAKIGDYEKIQVMISAGHNVNGLDSFGHAPCYYAIQNGHFDCVSLLVSNGANLNNFFNRQKESYFSH